MTVKELIEILQEYPADMIIKKEHEMLLHEIKAEDVLIYDYGTSQTLSI